MNWVSCGKYRNEYKEKKRDTGKNTHVSVSVICTIQIPTVDLLTIPISVY